LDNGGVKFRFLLEAPLFAKQKVAHQGNPLGCGRTSLKEGEKAPQDADFVAAASYFDKRELYPDLVRITAGPSLKNKFKGWNYEGVVREPHVVGFSGWSFDPFWEFVGLAQKDETATLSRRRREFEKEKRVTISIDGIPHVFGLGEAGMFYRGTLLSGKTLSLRGTLITTEDPITSKKQVYGIYSNERVPNSLAAYLADRHPEMK